jgi:prephenate dehydrogenase
MVGSHLRGVEAAVPDLYDKGFVFLIREPRIHAAAFREAKKFWRRIMPRVIEMNSRQHDSIVGEISHLPHAAAACLVLAAGNKSFPLTASGFKDSTRIAQGDPSIWVPIFRMNRREILRAVAVFEKKMRAFQKALRSKDEKSLRQILASAALKRTRI